MEYLQRPRQWCTYFQNDALELKWSCVLVCLLSWHLMQFTFILNNHIFYCAQFRDFRPTCSAKSPWTLDSIHGLKSWTNDLLSIFSLLICMLEVIISILWWLEIIFIKSLACNRYLINQDQYSRGSVVISLMILYFPKNKQKCIIIINMTSFLVKEEYIFIFKIKIFEFL